MTDPSQFGGENRDAIYASRLKEARQILDISQEEMADRVAVSPRSWQNYEAGRTVADGRLYARLCALGFRGEWLLGGAGPARATELAVGPGGSLVAVPQYDVTAAAGEGAAVLSESINHWLYFDREWLRREVGVSPSRLALIKAAGDSMAPTIEDGDLLLVDVQENRWKSDGVYVIGVEDEVWVKRLAKRLDGGLVISSDNPRYAHTTDTIERADIRSVRLVGRVVWVGGRI